MPKGEVKVPAAGPVYGDTQLVRVPPETMQAWTELLPKLTTKAVAAGPAGVGVGVGVGTGVGTGTGEVTGGRLKTPSPPGTVLNVGDKVGEDSSGLGLVGVGIEGLEEVGLEGVGLDGLEGEGESGVGKVLSGTGTSPRSTASGVTVEELKED
jgi:hypothetical protein